MNRRAYLAQLSAGAAPALALAGCLSGQNDTPATDSTPTPTPTPTPTQPPTSTPTPTATAEPAPTPTQTTVEQQPPQVENAGVVYRWEQYGDLEPNQMQSIGARSHPIVAFNYWLQSHDGSIDLTAQITLTGPDGGRLARETIEDEQISGNANEYNQWENALPLNPSSLTTGEHTLEIVIRDDIMGIASDVYRTTFDVVPRLQGNEASLESVDAPRSVTVGAPYQFTLQLGNATSQDNSLATTVSYRFNDGDWRAYSDRITCHLPAGGTNEWASSEVTFENTGTHHFRLDDINATWSVRVE